MSPFIVLLLLSAGPANAEYRRFDGPINAASNYVHYSEGYVVTPGYVDISNLWFKTAEDSARRLDGYYDDSGSESTVSRRSASLGGLVYH